MGEDEDARDRTQGCSGDVFLPAGREYAVEDGDQRVEVTEAGAGLRSFRVAGRELLTTFPPTGYATAAAYGQLLTPFPNRIDRGRYAFRGVTYQVPINEVDRGNAIHGLTRWMNWQVAEHDRDRLAMELVLHAQPGYPFVVHLRQEYALGRDGLTVTHTVRNVGSRPVPYGVGMHPYLQVGTDTIDSTTLRIPARSHIPQDDRLIPRPPAVSVTGTPYDFREPRRIGDLVLDRGFTDLVRDADGCARMWLEHPSGSPRITLWLDESHEWMWFATGDTDGRTGLAAEPYTCCSDAFNNGLGLRVIEPGESFRGSWGLRAEL